MCARIARLFLALLTLVLFVLSLKTHAADNVIIVGQAIDLSGPDASIGRDYVAGIKTYFDMVNSAGGMASP